MLLPSLAIVNCAAMNIGIHVFFFVFFFFVVVVVVVFYYGFLRVYSQ